MKVDDIAQSDSNIFLLWEDVVPSSTHLLQIRNCVRSIEALEPAKHVYLFSRCLEPIHFPGVDLDIIEWNYDTLGNGTPLEGKIPTATDWCLWSDVFRMVCLWRWGGTYFDVDDLMVREICAERNVMAACFLSDETSSSTWAGLPTIDGRFASGPTLLRERHRFRFGSDPLTRFQPRNPFLEQWLLRIPETTPENWGQVLPTLIFAEAPDWSRTHVTPKPWADLLFHPYDGGHHASDQRYPGHRISSRTPVASDQEGELLSRVLLDAYDFYLIKNHQFALGVDPDARPDLVQWMIRNLERVRGGSCGFQSSS
jgi:hypothetical protein